MALAIKRAHNLFPLSVMRVALKRAGFGVSEVAVKRAGCVSRLQSVFKVSLCLYTCTQQC